MKSLKKLLQSNFLKNNIGKVIRNSMKEKRKPVNASTIFTIAPLSSKIKSLKNEVKENFLYNGSFHQAAGPVLALAQVFAIMPVEGVRSKSTNDLNFSWKSYRTIYSAVIFFLISLNAICAILWLMYEKITFIRIVPVVFYLSSAYALICFAKLASKWPEIMRSWEEVERHLPPWSMPSTKKGCLAYKIKIISTVVIVTSITEHIFGIAAELSKHQSCRSIEDPMKRFIIAQLPHVFSCINYNSTKGVIAKIINIIATFMWNYTDLFLIIISVGLSSCFRQINDSLILSKNKVTTPETFWAEHRRAYRNLCTLCELVDDYISKITLVSFSNNLYFICVQLLWSLNPMPTMVHAFYFWFSFIYLISRTLAVTMYSAEINDQSKEPFKVIRVVPRESWCLEIKRFSNEVTRDIVALSGMKFFFLTRHMVLKVAATIVTYELVLIQFHEGTTVYAINQC